MALAPTLAYDAAVVGNRTGGGVPVEMLAGATLPALVLCGGASPDWMRAAGREVADALPDGRHQVLEGQGHDVDPDLLAPIVTGFLAGA